jgi:hypothetical protein
MSCDRFHEAIVDHACGGPIDDEAAAHLRSCEACVRISDQARQQLDAAESELRESLSLTASPELAGRVLARMQTITRRRASLRLWAGAGAAAALALAASWALPGRPPEIGAPAAERPAGMRAGASRPAHGEDRLGDVARQPDGSALAGTPKISESVGAAHESSVPRAPEPARSVATTDAGIRRSDARANGRRPRSGAPEEPVVLVDARQARALARLRELVRSGLVLDRGTLAETTGPSPEIAIPPLAIPDLPVTDMQGVGAQPSTGGEDRR